MSHREDDDHDAVSYAAYVNEVMQRGILGGQLPVVTTNPNRLEEQARKAMPTKGFAYIQSGAGESATMDANRLAFRQWRIVPRVLRPTNPRDLRVHLFGEKYGMD
ncbi:hypothetical protein DCS_04734 [Drechmeria coniospora]|uniref:FMN hydroxy acid dehydrogenase domain-containing protein n=1 Tax=Drechmeria coniospora TaxID=98403 RepID=A0A151GL18_DRECN|nr:hypothetical protein DCS_04734 [Drechmeria coniospora]KYK57721.1 hypothetical protein DCS_04734 [Drechmeria coniospora]